jgi:hypothetical protein
MTLDRRRALLSMLFGTGLVGLRSLATGIPASVLLNPRRAFADSEGGGAPSTITNPQFLIFSTAGSGDPFGCNAPGTYDDPNIAHPTDPSMVKTPINFGASTVNGAQIWSTLPSTVLSRTCFFHHATYTVIHPDEGKVLRMMGVVAGGEMLPSMISRQLQPALGTVRVQPISLSGNFSEAVYYQGAPQPLLTPTTLSSVLASPSNGLGTANLVKLRDQSLSELSAYARSIGSGASQAFIDQYATSVTQLRTLQSELLASLSALKDNSSDSQIQAAIILFQMKVTPAVVINIGFGGDNHGDPGLASEIAGHKSGVATILKMTQGLAAANLQDKVTFAMMNVFGRTMIAANNANANGRQHNADHHCTLMIGSGIQGGVVGGVAQPASGQEYQALPIDSSTGKGSTSGDVVFTSTFGAMGQTLAAACGLAPATISSNIVAGAIIKPALAG